VEQCVLRSDVAQTSPPPDGFAAANKSAVSRFPNPQSVRARTLRRFGNRRYSRFGNLRYIKNKTAAARFRAAAVCYKEGADFSTALPITVLSILYHSGRRLHHFNLGTHFLDLGGLLFDLVCESRYHFLLQLDHYL